MLTFYHFDRISIFLVLHHMVIIMVFRDTVCTYLATITRIRSKFIPVSSPVRWPKVVKITKSYRSTLSEKVTPIPFHKIFKKRPKLKFKQNNTSN